VRVLYDGRRHLDSEVSSYAANAFSRLVRNKMAAHAGRYPVPPL